MKFAIHILCRNAFLIVLNYCQISKVYDTDEHVHKYDLYFSNHCMEIWKRHFSHQTFISLISIFWAKSWSSYRWTPFHTGSACFRLKTYFLLENIIYPAPAVAGAAPPKNQGNRELLYMPQQPCPCSTTFFETPPRGVSISNCFNGLLRVLMKNSLEDCMSKFHLVKKWWDFENRDFGV